jgi:hypothetical protein
MVLVQIQFLNQLLTLLWVAFDPFNYTQFLALPKHLKILAYAYKGQATNLISTRIY